MEYRRFGASGIKVSPICLGAMMFGNATDYQTAGRIVGSAYDAGINFVDTADSYARGESERMLGKLIASSRDHWILATKVHNPMGDGPNQRGLSRRWLIQACDASLKRMGTDWIDVWYFHRDDRDTPLDETLGTVDDLIRAGKVRYYGLSNFQTWRIAEIVHTCGELGVTPPVACQPMYNLVNRQIENDLLPACDHYGIGVVTYSPLARGVLTAKYRTGAEPPAESRAGRKDQRILEDEYRPESLRIAQELKAHAKRRGTTASRFAMAWVLNNVYVTSALAGPRTLEQWQEYLAALDYRLDAADEALVDKLVPPGGSSSPGKPDVKFPVTGRVPR